MGIFIPMYEEEKKKAVYDPERNSGYEEFKEDMEKIGVDVLNDIPRSKEEIVERRRADLESKLKDIKVTQNEGKMKMRSRIHTFLSKELLEELNKICDREMLGKEGNNVKTKMVSELLTKYKIPFMELGTGTNRKAVLIDGYVFKFALDSWGRRDNANEYVMSDVLQPYVVKVYESNDLVAVTEYITLVTREEFVQNKPTIISILGRLAEEYLIGDVGYHPRNFANWGYRDNGQYVILDFAYIHRIQGHELFCSICTEGGYLRYDVNFHDLYCSSCGAKHSFSDIRKKITTEHELKEINDVKDTSYQMRTPESLFDIDISDDELKKLNQENKKKAGKNNMSTTNNTSIHILVGKDAEDDFEMFMNQVNSGDKISPIDTSKAISVDIMEKNQTPVVSEDTQVTIKNDPTILDQLAALGETVIRKEEDDKDEFEKFISGVADRKKPNTLMNTEEYVQESIDDLLDWVTEGADYVDQKLPEDQRGQMTTGKELGMLWPKPAFKKRFGPDKTRLPHQKGNRNGGNRNNNHRNNDNQNKPNNHNGGNNKPQNTSKPYDSKKDPNINSHGIRRENNNPPKNTKND